MEKKKQKTNVDNSQIDDEVNIGYNPNLVETNLRMIGDKSTIAEVVRLVAYIRHAVMNNLNKTIVVNIGENVVNTKFLFDVNGLEVQDYIAQDQISIN